MWLLYVACSMCLLFSNPYNMSYYYNDIVLQLRLSFLAQQYWFAIENIFLSQNNFIAIEINFLSQNINSSCWIILQLDTISSHLIWGLYNSSFSLEHQVCNIITIHYNSGVFLLSTMYSRMHVSPCSLLVEINTSICNWDFDVLHEHVTTVEIDFSRTTKLVNFWQ